MSSLSMASSVAFLDLRTIHIARSELNTAMSMACLFISNLQTRRHGFTIEIIKIHRNSELESNTCSLHLSVKYILNIDCNMNFRTLTPSFGFSTAMWLVTVSKSDMHVLWLKMIWFKCLKCIFMGKVGNNKQLYFLLAYIFKHNQYI